MDDYQAEEFITPIPDKYLNTEKMMRFSIREFENRWLEIECCKGITLLPFNKIIASGRDLLLSQLLFKLKCSKCGCQPRSVRLNETAIREYSDGSEPGWSIEIKKNAKSF